MPKTGFVRTQRRLLNPRYLKYLTIKHALKIDCASQACRGVRVTDKGVMRKKVHDQIVQNKSRSMFIFYMYTTDNCFK